MAAAVDSPFVRRVLVVLGLVAAFLVVGLLAWRGITALLVTFAGLLLAVFLRSLAQLVQRWWKLGDLAALAVVCVALLLATGAGALLLASPLQTQGAALIDELPKAAADLKDTINGLPLGQRVLARVTSPDGGGAPSAVRVVSVLSGLVSVLGNLLLVLFVGLFLAAEPGLYVRGVVRLLPLAARPRVTEVLGECGEKLQMWLVGRAGLMAVVSVLTWIGLMVLGIPLALALAAIAGLLTFIPNFGPIIAAVPAMLLALTQSPMQAVYVGALYLGIQTIESYTLEPYVMRKADDLPPALAIASQLFLGVTLGAMGLILATPLLVVVYLLVQRLYVEDVLGDRLAHDTDGEAAGSTSVASLGTPSLGARG